MSTPTRRTPPRRKTQTVEAAAEPATPTARTWEPHKLEGLDVRLYRNTGAPEAGVPKIDPAYCFRESIVREIAWAAWPHDNGAPTTSLLVGPKGCGKTTVITQLAARLNIPVMRVNCNSGTTVRHLKGRVGARKGSTVYVPGIVTMAMERGAWLLLDEVSGLTPPVALSLFPVLEPAGAVLLEDADPPRYVKRHPDFRIFCTDNTIGTAQEATRFNYAGTNDVNEALLDRIGSTIEVGYMTSEQEMAVVQQHAPGITSEINIHTLEGIIRIANRVRESGTGIAFSTRMVIDWARRVAAGAIDADGSPRELSDAEIFRAAGPAFLNRMRSSTERQAIEEMIQRVFGWSPDIGDAD